MFTKWVHVLVTFEMFEETEFVLGDGNLGC